MARTSRTAGTRPFRAEGLRWGAGLLVVGVALGLTAPAARADWDDDRWEAGVSGGTGDAFGAAPDEWRAPGRYGSPGPSPNAPLRHWDDRAVPDDEVDHHTFERALAPYGSWTRHAAWGTVWRPHGVVHDWAPYTVGRWVWLDEWGWTWDSFEPFGWATFHYGRWCWEPGLGWLWVPGAVWAPAWVSWRHGGGYVGWRPLPPHAYWGREPTSYGWWSDAPAAPGPFAWFFIEIGHFGYAHDVRRHFVPLHRCETLVRSTREVTRFRYSRGRVVNESLTTYEVERVTGKPVPRYHARSAASVEELRTRSRGRTETDVVLVPEPARGTRKRFDPPESDHGGERRGRGGAPPRTPEPPAERLRGAPLRSDPEPPPLATRKREPAGVPRTPPTAVDAPRERTAEPVERLRSRPVEVPPRTRGAPTRAPLERPPDGVAPAQRESGRRRDDRTPPPRTAPPRTAGEPSGWRPSQATPGGAPRTRPSVPPFVRPPPPPSPPPSVPAPPVRVRSRPSAEPAPAESEAAAGRYERGGGSRSGRSSSASTTWRSAR